LRENCGFGEGAAARIVSPQRTQRTQRFIIRKKNLLSQDWERGRVRVGILDSGFRRNDNEKPSLSHLVTPAKAGVQFNVRKNPSFHFRHFWTFSPQRAQRTQRFIIRK
jgi:hypothetical protein